MSILNILGTFREGRLSKKDTLVAIRLTLGDQADLKQDLLNILFHKDADWRMGDFDFGSHQPFSQGSPSPQFLQPAHQPQMRLPPISPLWYEASQNYPSTYSAGVFGSGVNGDCGLPLPSSMHQTPGQFCHPNVFTSPVLAESASFGPHMRSHEEDKIPERQQHGVEIVPQRNRSQYNWEDIDQSKGENRCHHEYQSLSLTSTQNQKPLTVSLGVLSPAVRCSIMRSLSPAITSTLHLFLAKLICFQTLRQRRDKWRPPALPCSESRLLSPLGKPSMICHHRRKSVIVKAQEFKLM